MYVFICMLMWKHSLTNFDPLTFYKKTFWIVQMASYHHKELLLHDWLLAWKKSIICSNPLHTFCHLFVVIEKWTILYWSLEVILQVVKIKHLSPLSDLFTCLNWLMSSNCKSKAVFTSIKLHCWHKLEPGPLFH